MVSNTLRLRYIVLSATLIFATAACTGETLEVRENTHGYQFDDKGDPVAEFVFFGWDERGCAQYYLNPLEEDAAVVAAMFVWDGEEFTTDQDKCKPGATP